MLQCPVRHVAGGPFVRESSQLSIPAAPGSSSIPTRREEPLLRSSAIMLATVVAIVFAVCLLFLPTGVAKIRNHPFALPIFLLNLFLGWTFVGWVAALFWACTSPEYEFSPAPYLPVPHAVAAYATAEMQTVFRPSSAAGLSASAPYPGQP
jgi:hypothetical protein